MNKSELIDSVAAGADITKIAAERAVNTLVDTVTAAVAKGDAVTLVGFGSFKAVKRAARVGRNPATGKEMKIAATVVPKFVAGAAFKGAVANKKGKK